MDAIAQAEDETSSAFSISQEDIDDALQSNSTDSKYCIYRQLTHSGDKKESIALLKEIYGIGGTVTPSLMASAVTSHTGATELPLTETTVTKSLP